MCVCVVLYAEGVGEMQGKALAGLSCCCTFPPREILTFPAHTHTFLSEGSLQVSVTSKDLKRARVEEEEEEEEKTKREVGPLPSCFSPSSISLLVSCHSLDVLVMVGDGHVQCWNS